MKRSVALVAGLLFLISTSACVADSPRVLIESYINTSSGPYTLVVDAFDNTTGERLHHDEVPVVGEYGPASLEYPSGHRVDVTVRAVIGGGNKIPMSSYVRLGDGGFGAKQKTCTPARTDMSSLECKVSTKY